ncbi:DM13 domain-containing protein [uncultured Tateyamaria sp.]|uniref:DM13 domain-containing protein n=1 Tax=uncultured Tateyamaria sp. TaxID=455651 RepID=UPI0026101AC1|nr:DM13 domain-containing protein [uncultured Tateyamaria sp.]
MFKTIQTVIAVALFAVISLTALTAQAETVGSGTFVGASDHITTGGVEITKNADGSHTITLGEDFSLDGAPDPRVGLGKDGNFNGNTDSGKLANLTGSQSFTVPAGIDIADFNEVYIWCEKFSVPLGVASLG